MSRTATYVGLGVGLAGLIALCVFAVRVALQPGYLGAASGQRFLIAYVTTAAVLGAAFSLLNERLRQRLVVFVTAICLVGILFVLAISGTISAAGVAASTLLVSLGLGAWAWKALSNSTPPWPAALTLGAGILSALTFLEGAPGAISPWTLGWPLVGAAVIMVGLGVAGRGPLALDAGAARRAVARLGRSSGTATVFCLLAVLAVWEAVWASAPELQVDALYMKAWLPALWAQSGKVAIATYVNHPQLGTTGSAELLAVAGHLLGQPATGRFLQYFATLTVVAAIWWYLARGGVRMAPVWALIVGITPQLVWQSSTAYDDALSALWCVGLTIAVAETVGYHGHQRARLGIVIGAVAGSCVAGKLTVAPFAAALFVGWWFMAGGSGRQRLFNGLALCGGFLVIWGPQRAWFWITTGNPVFPLFNNIFRSKYFAPTATNFNFPFFKPHGLGALLSLPWTSLSSPSRLVETTPSAGYGALLLLFFCALVLGWNRERALQLVWAALIVAFIAWWWQIRYLRYLVPYMPVAVVVLSGAPRYALGQLPARVGSLVRSPAFAALCAAIAFPATLASFWNVPQLVPWRVDAGLQNKVNYVDEAIPSAPAMFAVDRIAAPGSEIIGEGYARTLLRPGLEFSINWEFEAQQSLKRALPTSAPAIYRLARSQKVDWVLIDASGGGPGGGDRFLAKLVRAHGQLAFAAENWQLYRLVATPGEATPVCAPGTEARTCVLTKDVVHPWTVAEKVCSGTTYALTVENRGTAAWRAFVLFPSVGWDSDYVTVAGKSVGTLYATSPAGVSPTMIVSLSPLGEGDNLSEVTLKSSTVGGKC